MPRSCEYQVIFQKATSLSPVLWWLLSETFGWNVLVPPKSWPTAPLITFLTISPSTKKGSTSRQKMGVHSPSSTPSSLRAWRSHAGRRADCWAYVHNITQMQSIQANPGYATCCQRERDREREWRYRQEAAYACLSWSEGGRRETWGQSGRYAKEVKGCLCITFKVCEGS